MAKTITICVTDEDGFVLDSDKIEITEPICSVSVRVHGPGKCDAHSDLDLAIGRIEP